MISLSLSNPCQRPALLSATSLTNSISHSVTSCTYACRTYPVLRDSCSLQTFSEISSIFLIHSAAFPSVISQGHIAVIKFSDLERLEFLICDLQVYLGGVPYSYSHYDLVEIGLVSGSA